MSKNVLMETLMKVHIDELWETADMKTKQIGKAKFEAYVYSIFGKHLQDKGLDGESAPVLYCKFIAKELSLPEEEARELFLNFIVSRLEKLDGELKRYRKAKRF